MSKDIVSILSVHENPRNSTRSSVHRKLTKSPISTHSDSYGPAVTVTVDGFGMLDGDTVTELPVLSESSHALDFVVETESSHDPDFVVATESSPEVGIESHTAPRQSAPQIVYRYTFRNRNRMHVQVITYGATITAMCVPDRYGRVDDVLLGYDTLQAYVSERAPRYGSPPLLGATIGRCCNRIAGAQYQLDNECDDDDDDDDGNSNGVVHLTCNGPDGQNHWDGGFHGFDRCVWTPHLSGTVLTLTALSAAGTDGYPGTVMAHATFELLPENTFRVRYTATTTRPTPLNMCCNLLLNLAGHSAGHAELYRHVVTLNGDRTALADERDVDDVPTSGQLCCVGGTVMDLRVPHELGPAIARCPWGGYDGYWCLVRGSEQKHTFAGRVVHPASGRVLEVYTDQPGVRFYTGNRLPDPRADINPAEVYTQDFYEISSTTTGRLDKVRQYHIDIGKDDGRSLSTNSVTMMTEPEEECAEEDDEEECAEDDEEQQSLDFNKPIVGKLGALYMRHGGFSISPQAYPNAVNVREFPNVVLRPGTMYEHEVMYKFGIYRRQQQQHCERERLESKPEMNNWR